MMLKWDCPACNSESDFWTTMEELQCQHCGVAPNEAMKQKHKSDN